MPLRNSFAMFMYLAALGLRSAENNSVRVQYKTARPLE